MASLPRALASRNVLYSVRFNTVTQLVLGSVLCVPKDAVDLVPISAFPPNTSQPVPVGSTKSPSVPDIITNS